MQERRKSERIKSYAIMRFKEGFWRPEFETMTHDKSLNGVCFFSKKPMAIGKVISLTLYHDTGSAKKTIRGKVVWSRVCDDKLGNGYLNGLMFIK
jgi:hypothetical protein